MIKIKVEPIFVVKTAYELSRVVGLGVLQAKEEPLSDDEAACCIFGNSITMDYVFGRQCKFSAKIIGDYVEFNDERWYDHSSSELALLIARLHKEELIQGTQHAE